MGQGGYDNLVVDYCVANACAPTYVRQAAAVQGHALRHLEEIKIAKYRALYKRVGVDFKPMAMELHGAISDTFSKFLKKLSSAAAERNDIPYCIVFSYWQRRISTALQKNNARVLYLAQCKIDGQLPTGTSLGFADLYTAIINEEQHFHGDVCA